MVTQAANQDTRARIQPLGGLRKKHFGLKGSQPSTLDECIDPDRIERREIAGEPTNQRLARPNICGITEIQLP